MPKCYLSYRANPWGFVEKTFNMITFYDPKNEKIFEDSKEIRADFDMIMKKIIKHVRDKLEIQRKNWTLNQYDKYPWTADSPNLLKAVTKDLKEQATILAGIQKKFGKPGRYIRYEIENEFAIEFFKVKYKRKNHH